MVPMSSSEARFSPEQRSILKDIARASIKEGLNHGHPLHPDPLRYETALRELGACFVTLKHLGQLRGCIGSLEAYRPLVEDVADNAYAAAFRDPRFMPLTTAEFADLEIHLSILSPAEPMSFSDEQDLLAQIQPDIDGLVLEDRGHRGTFLPSVWESLQEKQDFWRHLKTKAGLPQDYWSNTLQVSRYTTESF